MGASSWPSPEELDWLRKKVAEMSGRDVRDVRVVVSPFRICPLGAHIDHQGGSVTAMTINMGILLGFVPSDDSQWNILGGCLSILPHVRLLEAVFLRSGQFKGEVRFRVDEAQFPKETRDESDWGCYARGALYALQRTGNQLKKGIVGFIHGSEEHSSGLSSSAAVGIAYLLALEGANNLTLSPKENIELDRLIENEFLNLRNGILDQSAILLSKYGCLTWMDCKTKEHKLLFSAKLHSSRHSRNAAYKILLAFSGSKQCLSTNPGYNNRVSECKEAARTLLCASGDKTSDALLCNVDPGSYEVHKGILKKKLAKRAEHYFSENKRVAEGLGAWASGNLEDFGKLISDSGRSSIENYECGCEPMIHLYEILKKAPGVFGARFSGAGFRGCCLALVDADHAEEAAAFVRHEYKRVHPELASQIHHDKLTLICEPGEAAHVL